MPAPLSVEKRGDREQKDRRQKGPDHGSDHAARSEAGILRRCVLHGSLRFASRTYSRAGSTGRGVLAAAATCLRDSLSRSFFLSLFPSSFRVVNLVA